MTTYYELTLIKLISLLRVQSVSEVKQATYDVLVPDKALVKIGHVVQALGKR